MSSRPAWGIIQTLSQHKKIKRAGRGSVIEHLPSMYKVLGLIPSTTKKEKGKKSKDSHMHATLPKSKLACGVLLQQTE